MMPKAKMVQLGDTPSEAGNSDPTPSQRNQSASVLKVKRVASSTTDMKKHPKRKSIKSKFNKPKITGKLRIKLPNIDSYAKELEFQ